MNRRGVDVERRRIDVHQDRRCPGKCHCIRRRDERHVRHDHFIAMTYAHRHQCKRDRRRSARYRDRIFASQQAANLLLELGRHFAIVEKIAGEDFAHQRRLSR